MTSQEVSRSRPGGLGGVSHYALRQTPPKQMATAAGGTHPTGMRSYLYILYCNLYILTLICKFY